MKFIGFGSQLNAEDDEKGEKIVLSFGLRWLDNNGAVLCMKEKEEKIGEGWC